MDGGVVPERADEIVVHDLVATALHRAFGYVEVFSLARVLDNPDVFQSFHRALRDVVTALRTGPAVLPALTAAPPNGDYRVSLEAPDFATVLFCGHCLVTSSRLVLDRQCDTHAAIAAWLASTTALDLAEAHITAAGPAYAALQQRVDDLRVEMAQQQARWDRHDRARQQDYERLHERYEALRQAVDRS